jgi:hypothetical protein
MSPLQVPEVLIVEWLGKRGLMVLEGMYRTMFTVEKGATIPDLR